MVNDGVIVFKSFESAVYCLLGSREIFVGETKKVSCVCVLSVPRSVTWDFR